MTEELNSVELTPVYDFENCRTVADLESPIYDQDLLAAIYVTKGNYNEISNLLKRPRSKIVKAVENNPEAFAYLIDMRESVIDKAEDNVFQMVMAGDKEMSKFVLTTLGKNRGYSTRTEQTGKNGEDLNPKDVSARDIAKAVASVLARSRTIEHDPNEKANGNSRIDRNGTFDRVHSDDVDASVSR